MATNNGGQAMGFLVLKVTGRCSLMVTWQGANECEFSMGIRVYSNGQSSTLINAADNCGILIK